MTADEIIEMAKQTFNFTDDDAPEEVIDFARLIIAKQIEIDAGICESVCDRARPSPSSHAFQSGAIACREMIRSVK